MSGGHFYTRYYLAGNFAFQSVLRATCDMIETILRATFTSSERLAPKMSTFVSAPCYHLYSIYWISWFHKDFTTTTTIRCYLSHVTKCRNYYIINHTSFWDRDMTSPIRLCI